MHRSAFFGLTVLLFFLASCVSTDIKDGQTAYRLKKYELAARLLQEDFGKEQDPRKKAAIALQIGESYRNFNDVARAGEWFKKAYTLKYSTYAQEQYALMLKAQEKYEEAIAEYKALIREEPFRRNEFNNQIRACEKALQWKERENLTDIENLSNLNTAGNDFSPVDDHRGHLVFTTSGKSAPEAPEDAWTGEPYFDLYMVDREHLRDSTPRPLLGINTPWNDGPAAFAPDGQTIYFTHCGSDDKWHNDICGIYESHLNPDDTWTEPTWIRFFEDSVSTGQPAISPDGQTMVFVANDPDGYGGSDLYYAVQTFEGWSQPVNLGSSVNTRGNEAFPYLDSRGDLWFASDGRAGLGGLDLYHAAYLPKAKTWDKPEWLPWPINTGADDFGYMELPFEPGEKKFIYAKGLFSSSRNGGQGGDDLYRFVIRKPEPVFYARGRALTKRLANPNDPNSEVLGYDSLPGTRLTLFVEEGGRYVQADTHRVDITASYFFTLEGGKDYRLFAANEPDYLNNSIDFTTKGLDVNPGDTLTLEKDIVLDKIFREVFINIDNIYYDYDDWHIRPDAAVVLDSLYRILTENPTIVVELGSHTDSRGSKQYNQELSQKRADAVVEYLVNKGIDPERLIAKGYGESEPVNNCVDGVECTEEEYQRNRRTTFKILSEEFKVESTEPADVIVGPKPDQH